MCVASPSRLVFVACCLVSSTSLAFSLRLVCCVCLAFCNFGLLTLAQFWHRFHRFFGPKSRRGFVHFRSKIASRRALGHLGASLRHVGVARRLQGPFGISHLAPKKPPGESPGGPCDAPWIFFESLGAPFSRNQCETCWLLSHRAFDVNFASNFHRFLTVF